MFFTLNIGMYFKFLLIFLVSRTSSEISVKQLNVTEMALYVQHFRDEIFLRNTNVLTVIRSVSDELDIDYVDEFLSEIAKTLKGLQLFMRNVNEDFVHYYSYYTILLIDSYASLRKIDPGPQTTAEDFSEYYLLIFYGNSENYEIELQNIFDYFWEFYIVNVALLLELDDQPVQLYTYYPFTHNGCHKAQLRMLNKEKSISNLRATQLFPDKFINLYGCNIMAALWDVPPYLTLPHSGQHFTAIKGVEGVLLNILAKELNFTLDFLIPPNHEQRGLVRKDGTLTGAIKMLHDRIADLSLGCFRCTLERSTILSSSMTFYQTVQVFTVLAIRQPWTSYEIISYPFDFYIWSLSMGLTLVLLLCTYILKYFHKTALKFIYGNTSSSLINASIVGLALGQPGSLEPQRNFARYFLTMWVLLTTILRSTYQGALFDFLHSQKSISPPDTAKELTQRQYKLIVNMATGDSFSGVPIIRDKQIEVLIMNITDAGGYPILEENPDMNYVTGTPRDFLVNYVNSHQKYGMFHVLSETIFTQQLCVYFTKHSYLVRAFNQILQNLISFGLIDHWAKNVFDDRFLKAVQERSGNVPLSMSQLSSIFEICLYLYVFAAAVLCIEFVWYRFKMYY